MTESSAPSSHATKLAAAFRLDGRVALVTGASRGIGRGIAHALAEAGAAVACAARTADQIEAVAADIRAAGGRAEAFRLDVTRSDDIRAVVADVERRLGGVDILVKTRA